MRNINKVEVLLRFSKEEIPVGQLVLDGNTIMFKYRAQFLEVGHNISPKKLSFDESIQKTDFSPFQGLFGVFADSLPDVWGQLLLRRSLSAQNISVEQLNSLDRLKHVGLNGPGALVYRPTIEENPKLKTVDLDGLNEHIDEILKGESEGIIDDLFIQGGSPGGARPKIFAGYKSADDQLIYGLNELPELYEHWIVKFAANVDASDSANSEMAYHMMAKQSGIDMSESKLFKGKSGKSYFGTKRFDRLGNDRIHLISAAGMFHDDYEHSQLDYGTLLYETSELINDFRETEQQFRRAVFNIFAHNRDDHSKNFGFLMNPQGKWSLAPAFDLTFSSSSQGMHSTTCARNGLNPGSRELMELATLFSINNAEDIIHEVKSVIREWDYFADQSGVSETSRKSIAKRLKEIDR